MITSAITYQQVKVHGHVRGHALWNIRGYVLGNVCGHVLGHVSGFLESAESLPNFQIRLNTFVLLSYSSCHCVIVLDLLLYSYTDEVTPGRVYITIYNVGTRELS